MVIVPKRAACIVSELVSWPCFETPATQLAQELLRHIQSDRFFIENPCNIATRPSDSRIRKPTLHISLEENAILGWKTPSSNRASDEVRRSSYRILSLPK